VPLKCDPAVNEICIHFKIENFKQTVSLKTSRNSARFRHIVWIFVAGVFFSGQNALTVMKMYKCALVVCAGPVRVLLPCYLGISRLVRSLRQLATTIRYRRSCLYSFCGFFSIHVKACFAKFRLSDCGETIMRVALMPLSLRPLRSL